MDFENCAFMPADIMLPAASVPMETWSCVACDQFTSEPEYWEKAEETAAGAPSALRLILPEYDLANSDIRVPEIHRAMREYLSEGLLETAVKGGFVLCERRTEHGVRTGLIGAVDLEQYSYEKGTASPVRPTEQTITSRLPPRLVIRRGAPVELTHIMLLIDDPGDLVLGPLKAEKASLRKLYDFELMMGGGHLTGYAVERTAALEGVRSALDSLKEKAGPEGILLAVGDGNHSLATAKAYWEEIKASLTPEERQNHPARFALCEAVNLYDPALLFEPIHRIISGIDRFTLMAEWKKRADSMGMRISEIPEPGDHVFRIVSESGEETAAVSNPEGAIPCATVQNFLDDILARCPDAEIDYIHGEDSLRALAKRPETVGLLLPEISKDTFFEDVRRLGTLPRKTFSMGEAREKRYYTEVRRI